MRPPNTISARMFPFSPRDLLVTVCILICAAGVCILLRAADTSDGFASPIFVLAVLLTSRLTTGYLFGLIAAVLGVICVNFIFTYPYWAFNLTISGYPLTFLSFLAVSPALGLPRSNARSSCGSKTRRRRCGPICCAPCPTTSARP